MKTAAKNNSQKSPKKVLKIVLIGLVILVVAVVGYRYYNQPAQTWTADTFEGRNPDKVGTKGQGQKYWAGNASGNGFYVTDEKIEASDKKTYCVAGAVASENASFTLGDSSATVKNGYFSHCAEVMVNDKHQLNFALTDGSLQVFSVARKR